MLRTIWKKRVQAIYCTCNVTKPYEISSKTILPLTSRHTSVCQVSERKKLIREHNASKKCDASDVNSSTLPFEEFRHLSTDTKRQKHWHDVQHKRQRAENNAKAAWKILRYWYDVFQISIHFTTMTDAVLQKRLKFHEFSISARLQNIFEN